VVNGLSLDTDNTVTVNSVMDYNAPVMHALSMPRDLSSDTLVGPNSRNILHKTHEEHCYSIKSI